MSNAPDFRLVVSPKYDPNAEGKQPGTRIGAAWKIVKDGDVVGLNIKLDKGLPPILLSSDFDLALWKVDDRDARNAPPATAPPADEFSDEEIPF